MTWNGASHGGFFPMYAVWNNGLKVTAIGGEDAITNAQRNRVLAGAMRTYAYTGGGGLTMDAWLGSIRAGHVFVTSGPLVELTVNGAMAGDEVTLPAGGGSVAVDARVRSIVPLAKAQLVFNGTVVEEIPIGTDGKSVAWNKTLRVTHSGWYHLRVEGRPGERFPLDTDYAQAFTNPVWVKVGTQPIRNRAAAEYGLRWVDKLQQLATSLNVFRSAAERAHVLAVYDEARQVYRRLAAEATPPATEPR
jgi:hypothetical protein